MRVAVGFLLLCEAFDVRSHLGHALLAVFRRGKTELLDKRAVEGAQRSKSRRIRNLGYTEVGRSQKAAGLGYSQ